MANKIPHSDYVDRILAWLDQQPMALLVHSLDPVGDLLFAVHVNQIATEANGILEPEKAAEAIYNGLLDGYIKANTGETRH